jgi:hypothetical protein
MRVFFISLSSAGMPTGGKISRKTDFFAYFQVLADAGELASTEGRTAEDDPGLTKIEPSSRLGLWHLLALRLGLGLGLWLGLRRCAGQCPWLAPVVPWRARKWKEISGGMGCTSASRRRGEGENRMSPVLSHGGRSFFGKDR